MSGIMVRKLKRELNLKEIVFLCMGAIIGTGVFLIPAIGARILGFSSLLVWLITGCLAIIMSMLFAELASMFDESGGIYIYVKKAFGNKIAFIVGWTAWVISWVTIAMLVAGGINYLGFIFNLTNFSRLILSISMIFLFTYINLKGIKYGARTQIIFTAFTFLILGAFVLVGLGFMDFGSIRFEPFSITNFLLAAAIIIEPYIGWQDATFLAEETKNARKIIPKGIVIGTILIAIIYFLVTLVALGSLGVLEGGMEAFTLAEAPLSLLAERFFAHGGILFSLGAVIVIFGCLNSWITTSPRLPYAMAKENMLPDFFRELNKNSVPANALIFQLFISSLIVLSGIMTGGFELFLKAMIPLAIFIYGIVFLAFIRLRKLYPKRKRYFYVPFGKIFAVFSIVYLVILLVQTTPDNFLRGATLVAMAIPFYFLVKMQADKAFQAKFFDKFSWLWDRFFPIWYSEKEARRVMKYAKVKYGQKVLEFGAGSGLTTPYLSRRVGKSGVVVSTDISENQLRKAKAKIEQKNLTNVILVKEKELSPFEPEMFDALLSVCVLEHFSDPVPRIEKLLEFLKKGAHFCFLSFGKTFLIPPPHFLKDEESIKKMFERAGYKVKVYQKKRLFAKYWFIYGEK